MEDVEAAISTLGKMVKSRGCLYIKVPCKTALFARLNRILPESLKVRLLKALFPSKVGDGFPAFYDRCTVTESEQILSKNNSG